MTDTVVVLTRLCWLNRRVPTGLRDSREEMRGLQRLERTSDTCGEMKPSKRPTSVATLTFNSTILRNSASSLSLSLDLSFRSRVKPKREALS